MGGRRAIEEFARVHQGEDWSRVVNDKCIRNEKTDHSHHGREKLVYAESVGKEERELLGENKKKSKGGLPQKRHGPRPWKGGVSCQFSP